MTDKKNIVLAIKTADCAPVLLYDPGNHAVAAVHAGWRSVKLGILPETLERMSVEYGSRPEDACCAIGPSIRSCCYEVQKDVADQFAGNSIIRRNGRLFLDLVKIIISQLLTAGLLPESVDDSKFCTCCDEKLFFSYRRDGVLTGRLMMAVVLR